MFYPDNETGIDVMPEIAPKQSDTVKWFTKGGKGIAPTVPGQDTWNIWQAELLNILNLANIKPDKTKLDQIAQAIKLIASAVIDNKIDDDGDIAYRNKINTFIKSNTFNDVTTFNKLATFSAGAKFTGTSRSQYYGSDSGVDFYDGSGRWKGCIVYNHESKLLRIRADDAMQILFHTLSADNDALQFTNKHINEQKNVPFTIFHTGNLTPVKTVNNVGPDANGNVEISTGSTVDLSNYYTKSEVDALINSGDYASATPGAVKSYGTFTTAEYSVFNIPAEGAKLNGSAIKFAGISHTQITPGSSPAGIWQVVSPANLTTGNATNLFFAVRIS